MTDFCYRVQTAAIALAGLALPLAPVSATVLTNYDVMYHLTGVTASGAGYRTLSFTATTLTPAQKTYYSSASTSYLIHQVYTTLAKAPVPVIAKPIFPGTTYFDSVTSWNTAVGGTARPVAGAVVSVRSAAPADIPDYVGLTICEGWSSMGMGDAGPNTLHQPPGVPCLTSYTDDTAKTLCSAAIVGGDTIDLGTTTTGVPTTVSRSVQLSCAPGTKTTWVLLPITGDGGVSVTPMSLGCVNKWAFPLVYQTSASGTNTFCLKITGRWNAPGAYRTSVPLLYMPM